jgi:His-Xaa-Ser system radical SAM maturase HxsB
VLRSIDLEAPGARRLVTNARGEYAVLTQSDELALRRGRLGSDHPRYNDLLALGMIDRPGRGGVGLEQAAERTRKAFLADGPALHIFVVTLRCDHACGYCQVSRAATGAAGFDMSWDDARAAIDRVFEAPAQALTVEFQGGEPALRFDMIERIVLEIEQLNALHQRNIRFSLVSTLHHLGEHELTFCRDHQIHISTSIDGPAALHDRQRPNPMRDSFARTVESLARARSVVGHEGVVAMPTLTRAAMADPKAVIDVYRELGFGSIFLRPISPYGFALKTRRAIGYDMAAFVAFYRQALDYLLALNRQGEPMVETYASILLRHIMTPFGSGYVDLRSPAGAGLGVLVYNYDGQVYPADEARMAAETGDTRFALGTVHDSFETLMSSPAMRWLATGAIAEQLPGCADCAFVPFCGADPVYHAAAHGDPIGDRTTSDFCTKHMGLFRILFGHIADGDPDTLHTFTTWAFNRSRDEVVEAGYVAQ